MQINTKHTKHSFLSATSAVIAGFLYASRWVWELTEGVLKNKQYPPSFVTQNFFLVKLLLIAALLGIYRNAENRKLARTGLLVAVLGLVWTAATRTLEAYGASGPWGFYSAPGLFLFFAGTLTAGIVTAKANQYGVLGKLLQTISLLYLAGGLASMLLFNLLGRDESANRVASSFANLFLIGEGVCWMLLGVSLFLQIKQAARDALQACR